MRERMIIMVGKVEESRVIAKTSDTKLELEVTDNKVVLKKTWYPIKGYGNYVSVNIEVTNEYVRTYQVNYNWNGTGSKTLAYVEDAELARKVREKLLNINSLGDVDNIIKEIEEYDVKISDAIHEKVHALIEKLQSIEEDEKVLKVLQSEDIEQKIIDLVKDYLL